MKSNKKSQSLQSSHFPNIHIVDWDMIDEIDPKVLSVSSDKKMMKKIIRNFLQANALFEDPSFCPTDLVIKYFYLLQISVQELVNENVQLKQIVKQQKTNFQKTEEKLPATIQKAQSLQTKNSKTQQTIFQCPFCPKVYYTPAFVHKHINKDHQADLKKFAQSAPVKKEKNVKKPKITTQIVQPQSNEELESIRDEIRAMFDHLDTSIKQDQEQQTTEFKKRFRELERKINARNIDEIENSKLGTRKMERTNSLATYSGHANSSSQSNSYSFSGSVDGASSYEGTDYNDYTYYSGNESKGPSSEED